MTAPRIGPSCHHGAAAAHLGVEHVLIVVDNDIAERNHVTREEVGAPPFLPAELPVDDLMGRELRRMEGRREGWEGGCGGLDTQLPVLVIPPRTNDSSVCVSTPLTS